MVEQETVRSVSGQLVSVAMRWLLVHRIHRRSHPADESCHRRLRLEAQPLHRGHNLLKDEGQSQSRHDGEDDHDGHGALFPWPTMAPTAP
jgi:hypothetical protein